MLADDDRGKPKAGSRRRTTNMDWIKTGIIIYSGDSGPPNLSRYTTVFLNFRNLRHIYIIDFVDFEHRHLLMSGSGGQQTEELLRIS